MFRSEMERQWSEKMTHQGSIARLFREISGFLHELAIFTDANPKDSGFSVSMRPISLNVEKALRYITSIKIERKK